MPAPSVTFTPVDDPRNLPSGEPPIEEPTEPLPTREEPGTGDTTPVEPPMIA